MKEKKACTLSGEMFFWTCNACGLPRPCIHCAETKEWLPKVCIRLAESIVTDTAKMTPEWIPFESLDGQGFTTAEILVSAYRNECMSRDEFTAYYYKSCMYVGGFGTKSVADVDARIWFEKNCVSCKSPCIAMKHAIYCFKKKTEKKGRK